MRRTLIPFLAVMGAAIASLLFWRAAVPDPGAIAWLVMLAAQFLIRAPWIAATRANRIIESRRDMVEQAMLAGAFLGMVVLPLLAVATPLLDVAAYRAPAWLVAPGLLFAAAGLWLFHRAHADLGRHWSPSVEAHAEQTLVTTGVYGCLRHPMYASIWLMSLAQACLVGNAIAGPAALIAFGVMYGRRMRTEEAMLAARFGEAWREYAARTGRVLPRLRP